MSQVDTKILARALRNVRALTMHERALDEAPLFFAEIAGVVDDALKGVCGCSECAAKDEEIKRLRGPTDEAKARHGGLRGVGAARRSLPKRRQIRDGWRAVEPSEHEKPDSGKPEPGEVYREETA